MSTSTDARRKEVLRAIVVARLSELRASATLLLDTLQDNAAAVAALASRGIQVVEQEEINQL